MSWQDAWQEEASQGTVATEKKEFELIPKGTYTAQVSNATVDKSTGQVSLEYTIAEGAFIRRKLWSNFRLEEAQSRKFFKMAMASMGFDAEVIAKPENVPAMLSAAKGKHVDLAVTQNPSKKTGKVYNNAYINGLKPEGFLPNEAPQGGVDTSEQIPF